VDVRGAKVCFRTTLAINHIFFLFSSPSLRGTRDQRASSATDRLSIIEGIHGDRFDQKDGIVSPQIGIAIAVRTAEDGVWDRLDTDSAEMVRRAGPTNGAVDQSSAIDASRIACFCKWGEGHSLDRE
jgi:hypothetical protein